jgi:hypothetical protein
MKYKYFEYGKKKNQDNILIRLNIKLYKLVKIQCKPIFKSHCYFSFNYMQKHIKIL